MQEQWQKDQAAKCPCRGSDEMCPCQNVKWGSDKRPKLREVVFVEVIPALEAMASEIRIGPDGEGQDWINTIEACIEDMRNAR
jgi:hypothetical protein